MVGRGGAPALCDLTAKGNLFMRRMLFIAGMFAAGVTLAGCTTSSDAPLEASTPTDTRPGSGPSISTSEMPGYCRDEVAIRNVTNPGRVQAASAVRQRDGSVTVDSIVDT